MPAIFAPQSDREIHPETSPGPGTTRPPAWDRSAAVGADYMRALAYTGIGALVGVGAVLLGLPVWWLIRRQAVRGRA